MRRWQSGYKVNYFTLYLVSRLCERIIDVYEMIGGSKIERPQKKKRSYKKQYMRRWQSGQLQETVNLPGYPYVGSNPTRRTSKLKVRPRVWLLVLTVVTDLKSVDCFD